MFGNDNQKVKGYYMAKKQGLVKGEIFRDLDFFWHGESTSTASQLTSQASKKK